MADKSEAISVDNIAHDEEELKNLVKSKVGKYDGSSVDGAFLFCYNNF